MPRRSIRESVRTYKYINLKYKYKWTNIFFSPAYLETPNHHANIVHKDIIKIKVVNHLAKRVAVVIIPIKMFKLDVNIARLASFKHLLLPQAVAIVQVANIQIKMQDQVVKVAHQVITNHRQARHLAQHAV